MTQASTHSPSADTRLVRTLRDLNLAGPDIANGRFAERLALLIDLPSSIVISETHDKLAKMKFESTAITGAAITEQFLQQRLALVQSVIKSFLPATHTSRLRFPRPEADTSVTAASEPYLQFYTAHQRQFEGRVQAIQSQVRAAASGLSPELARLCSVDAVMADTLNAYYRKTFAVIPRVLTQRFEYLLGECAQATAEADSRQQRWQQSLGQFQTEMQALLLAEIDARLLPILGLIETINEDTQRTHHE